MLAISIRIRPLMGAAPLGWYFRILLNLRVDEKSVFMILKVTKRANPGKMGCWHGRGCADTLNVC
jgi:hypothetical protein